MRSKVYMIGMAVGLLYVGQVMGQEQEVSGRVISAEDRAPLLGVNISIQNTDEGAITDRRGRYELKDLSAQDVLVFSFIGFQPVEETVGDRTVIDVVMTPEAIAGEELVVIGYGTQQRRDVTSSIFSLKEGSFTRGSSSDAQALFQGRIPGVVVTLSNGDVGAAPLIRIRGGTSVSAGNGPMFVIDGVPIDNSSATPIVPSGDEEQISDGTRDNFLSLLNPYDIASIEVLKDASAAAIYGARGGNGVILITTKEGRAGGFSLTYDGYTSASTQSKKYDLLTASEYKKFAGDVGATPENQSADTDWQDEIVRTAMTQSHNIAFSSGTQLTRYRVSLNYLDEEGIVLGSARQRITARLNLSHTALDEKLRLAVRINPTFIKKNNTPYRQRAGFLGGVFGNVLKMNPTVPVFETDGETYYDFPSLGVPSTGIRNPVALLKEIDDVSESLHIFANASAEYEFLPGLSAKANVGLSRTGSSRNIYYPTSLPFAAAFGGRADLINNTRQSVLFESTLNYRGDMGANQLEVWAGYTFQEFENTEFGATAKDFVTDAFSFNNLAGGADFLIRPFSSRSTNRLISFFGRVNASMANKLLLSAALRREGSSRFGADNKWGLFPSGSVGFRVTDDLKVRGSFGITGNEDIGNNRSLFILGSGANAVIGGQAVTGIAANQLANPDLKWEQTSQLNLGLDFGFAGNRFSGSLDVYSKTTTDLLVEFDVPQPAVVTTRLDNVGEIANTGIELALNTVNVSTGEFFWRTGFNFASNKNEVVDLGGRDKIVTGTVSGAGLSGVQSQIVLVGEPLGTFFGFKFEGYDPVTGDEILSSEGGPLEDGRQILGNAQPDFTFGISNIINYKNLDFSVDILGVWGIDILNNTRLEYQRPDNVSNGINLFAGAVDDFEAGLGANATVHFTDRFIEDGSYIRLQNVTAGYTLGTDRFSNLRIYVSADNLFVLTDYQGLDPEVHTFETEVDGVAALGIDYTSYPRARTFTLGLNIGF